MYSTNDFAGSAAPSSTAQELTSPYWAGSVPFGPLIAVTNPLFFASQAGSDWHCGQVGRASARSPASSSRMNGDQISMAALPAK